MLGRAAGVAAGVAMASLGLAYVAAQAGVADVTPLASDGEVPLAGRHLTPTVPAVLSPELAPDAVSTNVIVQPDPVAPPSAPVRTSDSVDMPEPAAEDQSPGRGATRDERPSDEPVEPGSDEGRDSRDGWSDLREWWESQSAEWDEAWREALSSEWSSDEGRSSFDEGDSRGQRGDRGRSGGR